jgi:hypothetical protein
VVAHNVFLVLLEPFGPVAVVGAHPVRVNNVVAQGLRRRNMNACLDFKKTTQATCSRSTKSVRLARPSARLPLLPQRSDTKAARARPLVERSAKDGDESALTMFSRSEYLHTSHHPPAHR